jgi:AraC-like DNA-binding protein
MPIVADRYDRWLAEALDGVQVFVGSLEHADALDVLIATKQWARSVPEPPDSMHRMVFGAVCANVVLRILERVHDGRNDGHCSCYLTAAKSLHDVSCCESGTTRRTLGQSVDRLAQAYAEAHPVSSARACARAIRRQPSIGWTLCEIAKDLGIAQRMLAREFHDEYGMSIREYVHLARINAAFPELIDTATKIEGIAFEAGYRSKKDFYRVLRRLFHVTPIELRRMPPLERVRLARMMAERLAGSNNSRSHRSR